MRAFSGRKIVAIIVILAFLLPLAPLRALAADEGPVNTAPAVLTVAEDAVLDFTGDAQITVADPAAAGDLRVSLAVSHGRLTLATTTDLVFVAGDGADDATMTITGSVASLNAALVTLTYVGEANFCGSDTLTIVTDDQGVTGDGLLSDTDRVTINVTPVNYAPTAANFGYVMDQDTTLTVAAPGVLASATDPDSDPLTAVLDITTGHGVLTLNTNGSFSYVPEADYEGADSFTYAAFDGLLASAAATVNLTVRHVNQAPVAVVDSFSTQEDAALTVPADSGVLANDSDADDDPLTAMLVQGPGHGQLTLDATGQFVYTPNAYWNGTDSFTYKANDGQADSSATAVTITVTPFNYAPVANADVYATNEDAPLTKSAVSGVLANDTDVDGDALTAVLVAGPTHASAANGGSFVLNANGSFAYTPDANWNGSDSFTYKANDGQVDSGTATVTVAVAPVNYPPVARNDNYTVAEDTALTVAAETGVLANDTDADRDALTAVLVAGPTHAAAANGGSFTLNADGSFSYLPDTNWNGTDSFTYKANDGQTNSGTVTVNIVVTAVNDAPVAKDEAYVTNEDTTLNISAGIGLLANDTDIEGDLLTAVVVAEPTLGAVVVNADGSFRYTPNPEANGTDTFTYTANDAQADSNIATVTISVRAINDPPVAVVDTYTIAEDTVLSTTIATGVLGNDSDVDGPALSANLIVRPQHGSLTFNADGSFSYTPSGNYNGSDFFGYQATDGSLMSGLTGVNITVTPVNDPPTANSATKTMYEDMGQITGKVAGSDVDGDSLTPSLVSDSTSGTGTLVFSADGSYTFAPKANWFGTTSFTFRVDDGTVDSNTGTVTLVVQPINDAPTLDNVVYAVDEDDTLTVTGGTGGTGVLAHATDVENDPLSASLCSGPRHGSLTFNADGSFTYVPESNYYGTDIFLVQVSDGLLTSNPATVTINVTNVNDPPVAAPEWYQLDNTTGSATLSVNAPGVLANDSDIDSGSLTAHLSTPAGNGTVTLNPTGQFTYTPSAGFSGTDSFTYHADDGQDASADVTVSVFVYGGGSGGGGGFSANINDSYATDEDTPLNVPAATGVLANDPVADGVTLRARLITGPQSGTLTLDEDGAFHYVPFDDYFGTDSFSYVTNNGTVDQNRATVWITVRPVNDGPDGAVDHFNVNEDTLLTVPTPGVLCNDTDEEQNEPFTASVVSNTSHGTLTLNANGSFTYEPALNYNGPDSFTYSAIDSLGVASGPIVVNIDVLPVNDLPDVADYTYSVAEDTLLTVAAAAGVLTTVSDVETAQPALTLTLERGTGRGTLTLNTSEGSFTYMPSLNFNGLDSFQYRLTDGDGAWTLGSATITVTPVNDAPTASADSYRLNEDLPLAVPAWAGLLINDSDVEGSPLTATVAAEPTNGTVTLNGNGSFTYTPALNFFGTDTFTYTVSDGQLSSLPATVTLSVNPISDPPAPQPDFYAVDEDTLLTVLASGVLDNDTDPDGDSLVAILATQAAHGTVVMSANGAFTYMPAANWNGTDSFTYKASDSILAPQTQTVTITVNPVNDAPVAVNDAYTTDEDVALVTSLGASPKGVLSNDTDIEKDALTAILVASPSHGSLTLNGDGTFVYTPAADYSGTDSFTYKANDGQADSGIATVTLTIRAVNDPPVANADSYTTAEHVNLNVPKATGVLQNDTDVDSTVLTASVVTNPGHGTVTVNGDGSFTYRPTGHYYGPDSFTYRTSDGSAFSLPATVTLTVTVVNDAPVAVGDTYTLDEDTTLTTNVATAPKGVLGNDSDVKGDPLTAIQVAGPTRGTLTLNADGTFTYRPNANYNGPDSFTYRASDGLLNSNDVTVTLTVRPVNDAPTAVDDSYNATEDTLLSVPAKGVLTNDSDMDGNVITAHLVTNASHGTVTLQSNGSFTYLPALDYNGPDSFSYKANDGSLDSGIATVSLSVAAVNDPPVAVADSYIATEDAPLTISADAGVLANDADVDSANLTAVSVSGPSHGSLALNADGSFTYTPSADYDGSDSFAYKANDGLLDSNSVSVTLTVTPVNDAPRPDADSYSTQEDTPLLVGAVAGVLTNDTEVDGDAMTAVLATAPTHGTVTLNSNGSFSYTPAQDYFGPDSFTYTAVDEHGAVGDSIDVTIDVQAVNDAPVNVMPAAQESPVSATLTLSLAAGNQIQVSDIDAGDGLVKVTLTTDHGTLLVKTIGGVTFLAGGANGSATVILTGTLAALNSALDGLQFLPTPEYRGSATVTITTDDQGNSGAGGRLTDTDSVTVDLVNRAPVFTSALANTAQTISEGQGMTSLAATDDDGDRLTYTMTSGTLPQGISSNPDGTFSGSASYASAGSYIAGFRVSDGKGGQAVTTLTIRVLNTNRPPELTALPDRTNMEGETVSFGVNASDPDGTALTYVLLGAPAGITNSDSNVRGTLGLNTAGTYSVTVTVTDWEGLSATRSFTWTVRPASGVIRGTVTDSGSGGGLAGISINIADSTGKQIATATTGADGTYRTGTLSPGGYTVTFAGQGFTTASATTTVVTNGVAVVDLALQARTAAVWGVVTDKASGRPLAGATVTLTQGETVRTQSTDAAGTYRFTGVSSIQQFSLKTALTGYLSGQAGPLALLPGGTVRTDFTLARPSLLTITAPADGVTVQTAPVVVGGFEPNATVTVMVGGRSVGTARTDTAGRWTFALATVADWLVIGPNTVTATGKDVAGQTALSNAVTFRFNPNGGLNGHVTADSGAPAGELRVQLHDASGALIRSTTTGSDGGYAFEKVPAGTYTVKVLSTADAELVRGQVVVPLNQTATLDLVLPGRAVLTLVANPAQLVGDGSSVSTLTATVMLKDGTPLSGANVSFVVDGGALATAGCTTGADGRGVTDLTAPRLTGITPTSTTITAVVRDPLRGIFAQATIVVTFVPASINGVVVDTTTGRPANGATVALQEDFDGDGVIDFAATVTTGPDGRYSLYVPRGDWVYRPVVTVRLQANGQTIDVATTHEAPVGALTGVGEQINAGRTIGGQLLLAGGPTATPQPFAQALQESAVQGTLLSTTGDPVGLPVRIKTDGSFAVQGVNPGQYRLHFQVTAPTGEVLAATDVSVAVDQDGELAVVTSLIDPYGTVTDATTGEPVKGATVTLMWADTPGNRSAGHIPGTAVNLPVLPDFTPNQNRVPQDTTSTGAYAWLVYPGADYYIVATRDGYLPYDSRQEARSQAAVPGEDSSITAGIIHIGQSLLQYDFQMVPSDSGAPLIPERPREAKGTHLRYVLGYPNGEFGPNRPITRAEVAAIMSRIMGLNESSYTSTPYRDVNTNQWFTGYIGAVYAKGVMTGYPDGTFRPNAAITRAEIAAVLARLRALAPLSRTLPLSDMAGHWAQGWIAASVKGNLLKGYPDGSFRPDLQMTRAEFVTAIDRLLCRGPLLDRPGQRWPDVPVSYWAYGDILEASIPHSFNGVPGPAEVWTGDVQ